MGNTPGRKRTPFPTCALCMSVAAPFRADVRTDPDTLVAAFLACPESLAVVERGVIQAANPAFASLFGYPSTLNLHGKRLADLLPSKHPCGSSGQGAFDSANCGFPGCHYQRRRENGSHAWLESFCSEFDYDGRKLQIVTAHELSQRERRRLSRDSEKRYRAIFGAAAIGIVQCSMDGRVVESNYALEQMLGYTHQELRGMHFRDFIYRDNGELDLRLFQEMVAGTRDRYQVELRFLRKEKSYGWCRLNVSLVRGPAGEPAFVIGMVDDISEQKRAEQQLCEAQKMEALGRLVGGIAHDFNNLLTAVILYSDLIAAGLDHGSRLHRHVGEIRMASEQGAALIQQLLSIVRQQPVEPQVLSISDVVIHMRDMLARLIGENIELVTALTPCAANVKIDPAQMQQIILNLVLNARDAMSEGGTITIETRICEGPHSTSNDDDELSLVRCAEMIVRDNGTGMDSATLSHLFEPFFTTKTPGQGIGLGLATVHNIVKQAGGNITVQSQVGSGTSITIRLPQVEDATQGVPRFKRTASKKGRETILLVEDDSAVRHSVGRVLTRSGYKVLKATNGAEALRVSRGYDGRIDLLLTDLVMPGISGREVARCLCQQRLDLSVLFTSGYDQGQLLTSSDELAGLNLFRKPFTGTALASKVREVLDARAPQKTFARRKR